VEYSHSITNGVVYLKFPFEGEEEKFLVQLSGAIEDAQEAARAIKSEK